MGADGTLIYEAGEGIARLTLNRPDKRNALNDELIAALKRALRRAHDDATIRVAILTGAGSDFCSGADLAALQRISTASVAANLVDARSLMELFMLIRQVRIPVIAAVRGCALAGGCGLAMACDMVLAQEGARFGFPEVKIGFVPAMVTAILRRNVSEKRAFELLTVGREIDATEAATIGLVNHVFERATFDDQVKECAGQFTKVSQSAVELTKRLLYRTGELSFEDSLAAGADVNVTARMTNDVKKGIAAFLSRSGRPNREA